MKKKDIQFIFISILVLCIVNFMTGMYVMDASAGAIASIGNAQYVTVFGIQNPFVAYHLGLIIVVVSFVCLSLLSGYLVVYKIGSNNQ